MFVMQTYLLALVTGLTTGGVSCFAVQGSLLASLLASNEETNLVKKLRIKSLVLFLVSKVVSYTVAGFFLGMIGEKLIIIPRVQGWFQIAIGIFMLLTAANLAKIHPFFRHFVITPPKFAFKILRNQTKLRSAFAPVFLGALTVLIPCGVTQAMMLMAISSGNPVTSALILFFFTLGTSPVFFGIGFAASELFKRKIFSVVAAIVVAMLGIISINSGQVLRGSPHTFQNYWRVALGNSVSGDTAPVVDGYQIVEMKVTPHGYETNVKKLQAGIPVKLTLTTNSVAGCSRAFTIPDYNILKVLPQTGTYEIVFTPEKLGNLTYTCSMGMYSGYFDIIK